MTKIFVSHNHKDKAIARRIVRFLRCYGVNAWLDERELRLGNRLDDSIRAAISESDAVVVVASSAGARSQWVQREIAFACEASPPISICPVYIDDVISSATFSPHLGVDAMDRHRFVEVLEQVRNAFSGTPLPETGPADFEACLADVSAKNSAVAVLVETCLHGSGLKYEHVQLASNVDFHELDDALYWISRLGGNEGAASATACLFARTGAGSAALSQYAAAGFDVLVQAVGDKVPAGAIDAAVRLLGAQKPPADQALSLFLFHNTEALAREQRADTIVRLVSYPERPPSHFGANAAAAAFDVFPDRDDLVQLWSRWIRNGYFDGGAKAGAVSCDVLLSWCTRGLQMHLSGWNGVFTELCKHVRHLARSKSRESIETALEHMFCAAREKNTRAGELITECSGAAAAAEWDGWEHQEEMRYYVGEMISEAGGTRPWEVAWERTELSWRVLHGRRKRKALKAGNDSS